VCDLETSRMGAPYIYDISRLRVNYAIVSIFCVVTVGLASLSPYDFRNILNMSVH